MLQVALANEDGRKCFAGAQVWLCLVGGRESIFEAFQRDGSLNQKDRAARRQPVIACEGEGQDLEVQGS